MRTPAIKAPGLVAIVTKHLVGVGTPALQHPGHSHSGCDPAFSVRRSTASDVLKREKLELRFTTTRAAAVIQRQKRQAAPFSVFFVAGLPILGTLIAATAGRRFDPTTKRACSRPLALGSPPAPVLATFSPLFICTPRYGFHLDSLYKNADVLFPRHALARAMVLLEIIVPPQPQEQARMP